MELKLTVDGLEKERDFYFSKLRDIELICQEHESENNPILSRIIDILYATEVSILYQQQIQAALHHFHLRALYSLSYYREPEGNLQSSIPEISTPHLKPY